MSAWDAPIMAAGTQERAVDGTVAVSSQDSRRPPIILRLVTLALVAGAAVVVITATGPGHAPNRARVAATTLPSVVVPNGEPAVVQILAAERNGDAILLRVDPVGAQGALTLVVSPGAHVAGSSLQALLADATDRQDAIHHVRYQLSYDASGAIVAITPTR
ncbi:MAG: hypothetical protein ACJ735_14875 [Actinomycetes bacterium]